MKAKTLRDLRMQAKLDFMDNLAESIVMGRGESRAIEMAYEFAAKKAKRGSDIAIFGRSDVPEELPLCEDSFASEKKARMNDLIDKVAKTVMEVIPSGYYGPKALTVYSPECDSTEPPTNEHVDDEPDDYDDDDFMVNCGDRPEGDRPAEVDSPLGQLNDALRNFNFKPYAIKQRVLAARITRLAGSPDGNMAFVGSASDPGQVGFCNTAFAVPDGLRVSIGDWVCATIPGTEEGFQFLDNDSFHRNLVAVN